MVSGNSNGEQGARFPSTHFPDNVIGVAPVFAHSSIENYVSFNLWQDAEPPVMSVLHTTRSSYRHELLLDNSTDILVMQQRGSEDDNVPAYPSRFMHELMALAGFPSTRSLL